MEETEIICPWCNRVADIIWVHGHGQCSSCGLNINECCSGEQCTIIPDRNNDEEEKYD
jgi:hypothetical protein